MNNQQQDHAFGSDRRLLSINEVSDALQISRWMVYQLINRRELNTIKIRSRRLVAPEDLQDYIARLRANGEAYRG